MAVGVRHQLVGFLGRGVEADRVIDRMVLAERQPGVGAVDAGAAGVGQMLDLPMPAQFQHVEEGDQVGLGVGVRVVDRVAHAGLRGQVQHALWLPVAQGGLHARQVGQVLLDEAEVGVAGQLREPVALELDVVVGRQIVDADHLVAAFEQAQCGVHADETGTAGEQNLHVESFQAAIRRNLCQRHRRQRVQHA